MKPLFLLLALCPLAASAPLPIKNYPMRGIPKTDPRFTTVLEAVQKAIDRKARPHAAQPSTGTEAASPKPDNDKAPLEDVGPVASSITILRTLAPGRFIALNTNGASIQLRIPDARIPDNTIVRGNLIPTDETYQFTSSDGTNRNIKTYNFTPDQDSPMSPERFIDRLMTGDTFTIQLGATDSICKACNGWGRVNGPKIGSPKVPCATCNSTGKISVSQMVRICW